MRYRNGAFGMNLARRFMLGYSSLVAYAKRNNSKQCKNSNAVLFLYRNGYLVQCQPHDNIAYHLLTPPFFLK